MSQTFEIVPFHNTQLEAVREFDAVWVSLRRMCEALGIDLKSQHRKLSKYSWVEGRMVMKTMRDSAGREQQAVCLHLDAVPMWLATIEPSRVSEKARPTLALFQRECARVLADHFFGRRGGGGITGSGRADPNVVEMTKAVASLTEAVAATFTAARTTAEDLASLKAEFTDIKRQIAAGGRLTGGAPVQRRALPPASPQVCEDPMVTVRRSTDGDLGRNINHRFGGDPGGVHNRAINSTLKNRIGKSRSAWALDDYRNAVDICEREFGFQMTMTRLALMAAGGR